MPLTLAPGSQETSLWGGSCQNIGPSIPLRIEWPAMVTLLFFSFIKVVVICGVS